MNSQLTARCRVAYQGGPGCNSEQVGMKLLSERFSGRPFASFAEVAAALANGHADLALFPVRNSTTGPVAAAIAAIRAHGLARVAETSMPVHHYLMAPANAPRAGLRQVLGHAQVLQQCSRWLRQSGLTPRQVDDAARVAVEVANGHRRDIALLGPIGIGRATGLYCLEGPVQDRADNRTTFWLLEKHIASSGRRGMQR